MKTSVITHLAVITRIINIKLVILKGGKFEEPKFVQHLSYIMQNAVRTIFEQFYFVVLRGGGKLEKSRKFI